MDTIEEKNKKILDLKYKKKLTMQERVLLSRLEKEVVDEENEGVSSRNTYKQIPARSMFSVKTEQAHLEYVKIADIKPNPFQPRKHPSEKEVDELEALIRREGLLQPILVTKRDGETLLIAGQKRLMVFDRCNKEEKEKGLEAIEMKYFKIACLVLDDCTDLEMATMALVENEGRKNPLFLDTANAIKDHFEMLKKVDPELSQNRYTEIAAALFNIGTKGTVSKYLKIATLEQEVQEEIFKIRFNQFTKLYEIARSSVSIEEKIQELYKEEENQKIGEEDPEEEYEKEASREEGGTDIVEPEGAGAEKLLVEPKKKGATLSKGDSGDEHKKSKSKIDIDYLIDTIQNLDATNIEEDKERIKEELLTYLREFQ